MAILVTGGAGFIGSHLVDALIGRGHDVLVLDDLSTGKADNLPATAKLTVASITDRATLDEAVAATDAAVHLAAIASVQRSVEDWPGTHAVNLSATVALFDAAAKRGKPYPVVYASSAAIYGNPSVQPVSEALPAQPLSAYGADKYGCELAARVAGAVHGVPSFGLRFFNVYGPRQDPSSPYSGVLSIFQARAQAKAPIAVFGDGGQTRDFVHVSDVVRALLGALDRAAAAAPVCNICTGQSVSIRSVAERLQALAGSDAGLLFAPARPGDIRDSRGDATLAASLLNWRAAVSIETGLADLLTAS